MKVTHGIHPSVGNEDISKEGSQTLAVIAEARYQLTQPYLENAASLKKVGQNEKRQQIATEIDTSKNKINSMASPYLSKANSGSTLKSTLVPKSGQKPTHKLSLSQKGFQTVPQGTPSLDSS